MISRLALACLLLWALPAAAQSIYAYPQALGGAAGGALTGTYPSPTLAAPVLTGTSAAIGGGVLLAGACSTGTATVTGATTAMVATASPATYPGIGATWFAQVTAADTVTVYVCAIVGLTPTSTTYAVRVQ